MLTNPAADDSKLKNLKQNAAFLRKFESSSPDQLSDALFEYGVYGQNSSYLRRCTQKEVSSLKSQDLLDLLATTLKANYSVHYSGTLNIKDLISSFEGNLKLEKSQTNKDFPVILPRVEYTENTILILDDPKSLQSRIYFYVNGNENDPKERAIAAAYISILEQECRQLFSKKLGNSARWHILLMQFTEMAKILKKKDICKLLSERKATKQLMLLALWIA